MTEARLDETAIKKKKLLRQQGRLPRIKVKMLFKIKHTYPTNDDTRLSFEIRWYFAPPKSISDVFCLLISVSLIYCPWRTGFLRTSSKQWRKSTRECCKAFSCPWTQSSGYDELKERFPIKYVGLLRREWRNKGAMDGESELFLILCCLSVSVLLFCLTGLDVKTPQKWPTLCQTCIKFYQDEPFEWNLLSCQSFGFLYDKSRTAGRRCVVLCVWLLLHIHTYSFINKVDRCNLDNKWHAK